MTDIDGFEIFGNGFIVDTALQCISQELFSTGITGQLAMKVQAIVTIKMMTKIMILNTTTMMVICTNDSCI